MTSRRRTESKPLACFPARAARAVKGVFTDIDDTLSSDGQLRAQAYTALERLHERGLLVVPVTGRPAGWCDHIARMWPVDGVIGENGAFYMRYDRRECRMHTVFEVDAQQRARHRAALQALARRILDAVPGAALASDQAYRLSDLAIDYCEDVPPLAPQAVDTIVKMFEEAGATAKVSSIHVNGWFGQHDKLSMSKRFMAQCHDVALDRDREHYVFIGDSPNDAPMFGYFPHSVGVANVRRFANALGAPPAYVTLAESGAGFAELATRLLDAR